MKVRFYACGILVLGLTALLVSCKAPTPNKVWVVSTLAGSTRGYKNDTGTAAKFEQPYGVAVDSNGNVYVADEGNHCIRKIAPAGMVSTLAGIGKEAFLDGTGTEAKFNYPRGVALDSAGNVYVGDTFNQRIRKITIDSSGVGEVTTLAGSARAFADGTGTAANFDLPTGVAVDSDGIIYVADFSNNRIRKITINSNGVGEVTTLAGSTQGYRDGGTAEAQFNEPTGVAVDSAGNVYVADYGNNRIRKITKAGVVSTLAGSAKGFKDGNCTEAQFNSPRGVAVDSSGNVYVADSDNHRIRKITAEGVVTTLAGTGDAAFLDATATAAKFNDPHGVAVDSNGTVYVAEQANHRIRKIEYRVP